MALMARLVYSWRAPTQRQVLGRPTTDIRVVGHREVRRANMYSELPRHGVRILFLREAGAYARARGGTLSHRLCAGAFCCLARAVHRL